MAGANVFQAVITWGCSFFFRLVVSFDAPFSEPEANVRRSFLAQGLGFIRDIYCSSATQKITMTPWKICLGRFLQVVCLQRSKKLERL